MHTLSTVGNLGDSSLDTIYALKFALPETDAENLSAEITSSGEIFFPFWIQLTAATLVSLSLAGRILTIRNTFQGSFTQVMPIILKWFLYTLLGLIADTLDLIIISMRPDKRPKLSMMASDVDHLSDEEIVERAKDAPWLGKECRVKRLTAKTVLKPGYDPDFDRVDSAEANALNLVFAESTIPVPRVHRVIKFYDEFLIVMDYIPGRTLAEAWPTLSTWQKIGVAWTLRRYIRQLRRLKASDKTPPGPISGDRPRGGQSPVFGQVRPYRGPFASYAELSRFFNERQKMTADEKNIALDVPFDDSMPLVLSHQDLNLRNMILGADAHLWIVDWAWSGYYPQWFEYVAMQNQNEIKRVSGSDDNFWKVLIPFIVGPYFQQEMWLRSMGWSLDYFE
ncbi:hypothetical protein C0995_011739 [Termitomyces sp. Mi166|nr:hypothetical protein C0995_011739 [Termitomyces sp. Mi166\